MEVPPTRRSPGMRLLILNLLTVAMLLASICVMGVYLALFINPQIGINPWKPPTPLPTLGPPTATATPEIYLPPAWTATPPVVPTSAPTSTPLPAPTETPAPSETPQAAAPTETQVAEATEQPFVVQASTPLGVVAWFKLPTPGCNYMGVGGQVFDASGAPINALGVRMGGSLGDEDIGTLDSLTRQDSPMGPGGYLFDLGDKPIASSDTLWVQLQDPADGVPLSEKVFLTTSDKCEANLVLVNWRKTAP